MQCLKGLERTFFISVKLLFFNGFEYYFESGGGNLATLSDDGRLISLPFSP